MKALFLLILILSSISSQAGIYLREFSQGQDVTSCSGVIRSVRITNGGVINEKSELLRVVYVYLTSDDNQCNAIYFDGNDFNIGVTLSNLVGKKIIGDKFPGTKDGQGVSIEVLN